MNNFDREEIIKKAKVRDAFTPNKPVDSIELLCGRINEVSKIMECVGTEGQHIILYGDRGVGKTSLSRMSCAILRMEGIIPNYHIKQCDSSDTFQSIMMSLFEEMGIECVIKKTKSFNLNVFWNLLSINKGTQKEVITYDDINSPSWVAKRIENTTGVFLIDEFDVIKNISEKAKISELIKQLSDKNSKLTIFIVGISGTANDLIGGHSSIQRCIKEIELNRMSNQELSDIILKGEERLQIKFNKTIKNKIIKHSGGFPYFTQLLALKSAEEAICKELKEVTLTEYKEAIKRAVEDMPGELRTKYKLAVYGLKTARNKNILLAAAVCGEDMFTTESLKESYHTITGERIITTEITNYMSSNNTIVSNNHDTILRRVKKGVFIFNDPRMPSFIKIANNYIE